MIMILCMEKVELGKTMDLNEYKITQPLNSIIDFAKESGADQFWINNAKDELKKLREELHKLYSIFDKPTAWARINSRGDIFDLRLQNNPYVDQKTVIKLYAKK